MLFFIKEIGLIINVMVKEYLNGKMEMFMKENLKIMIKMDMVY